MNNSVLEKKHLLNLLDEFRSSVQSNIRQRGNEVFQANKNNPFTMSDDGTEFLVQITSSDGSTAYDVELSVDQDEDFIYGTCSCPYTEESDETCKHQLAASFMWKESLKGKNTPSSPSTAPKPRQPKVIQLASVYKVLINDSSLGSREVQNFIPYRRHQQFDTFLADFVEDMDQKTILAEYSSNRVTNKAAVAHVGNNKLEFSCTCCKISAKQFCYHLIDLIDQISDEYGDYYFRIFDDHSEKYAEELRKFGLKPGDEAAKDLKFGIDQHGNFGLIEKPSNLLPISSMQNLDSFAETLGLNKPSPPLTVTLKSLPDGWLETGLLLYVKGKWSLSLWLDGLYFVKRKLTERGIEKFNFKRPEDLYPFADLPPEVLSELEKISEEQMISYLVEQGQGYLLGYASPWTQLSENSKRIVELRYHEVLENLRQFLTSYQHLYLLCEEKKPTIHNVKKISFSSQIPSFRFQLQLQGNILKLHCKVILGEREHYLSEYSVYKPGLLIMNDELFVVKKEDLNVIAAFSNGSMMIHEQGKMNIFQKILQPLAEKYPVDLNDLIRFEEINSNPIGKIYLSELNENFLLIKPKWQYDQLHVENDGKEESIVEQDKTVFKILRKPHEEEPLRELVRVTHDTFKLQRREFFYLSFDAAMKNNWFIHFYQKMQEAGIPVFGLNELKKFRYNTNKPKMNWGASSGTDWFDLKVEVKYGDQVVPISALRKAIMLKQDYILLDDGSLGMLPKDWIERYSMMMKIGEIKDDTVRLSKFHWTVIDELHQEIDNSLLLEELEEKKKRLRDIDNHETVVIPASVNAEMRDYQLSGFQWLTLLDHLGWGGILADDMGLGKTLQSLAFLQHLKEKSSGETHLIICPTSLIYNWESEIQKFTPQLSYHIHYGVERKFNHEEFKKYDLIITSYGAVRSDIEKFTKFRFGYIIIDESQQIKNPTAQITKAIQLLSSRNKIALSGTPVQNNTFDLFSQMNTLNRGIFGSMEFFKSEFASPIDKYGDKKKTIELQKLIYPFLLRRTKEQVAKDLPDKTETILWCEMESKQREIYESFKDHYRSSILQRIDHDGLNKSSIYIIEGLMKLRQICDSPAILNEKERFPNVSVKLEELIRELEENTGKHKSLVFSQFVTMLSLVKSKLDERGISYQYLDGSTSAENRKKAVEEFQSDSDIHVFLISLKAGGLGLNLTAADYVYLIDPWWNPAAEQQAIDRTHRIGQTNKIFAYRMICKNSIEEKILIMQQRKRALAADLVSDESGFVKKLTREDVEFLFS